MKIVKNIVQTIEIFTNTCENVVKMIKDRHDL